MNTKLKQRTDKGASVSKRNIRPGVRILHIIKNTFILLLVIAAVSMMVFTIVSVTTFDRNDRDLFGYKAFIVLSLIHISEPTRHHSIPVNSNR